MASFTTLCWSSVKTVSPMNHIVSSLLCFAAIKCPWRSWHHSKVIAIQNGCGTKRSIGMRGYLEAMANITIHRTFGKLCLPSSGDFQR